MGKYRKTSHILHALWQLLYYWFILLRNLQDLRQARDKCFTLEDWVSSILSIIYRSRINGCNGSFLKLRTVEFSLMKVRLKPVDCFSSDSCSAQPQWCQASPPLPLHPPPVIANPKSPTPSPHPRTRCIELKAVFVIAAPCHTRHTHISVNCTDGTAHRRNA